MEPAQYLLLKDMIAAEEKAPSNPFVVVDTFGSGTFLSHPGWGNPEVEAESVNVVYESHRFILDPQLASLSAFTSSASPSITSSRAFASDSTLM